MRRLLASSVAVAVLGLVPAVTASASARTVGSITVTAIDRHGQPVAVTVHAVNLTHDTSFDFRSGVHRRAPRGRYDVFAAVPDGTDDSMTVAVRRVLVDGDEKLTFDARRGHRIGAALQPAPPAGSNRTIGVAVCLGGHDELRLWPGDRPVYAVPSSLDEISLGVSATWAPLAFSPGPVFVGAVGYPGVPTHVAPTIRQSHLATITINGRGGYAVGWQDVELAGHYRDTCRSEVLDAHLYAMVPYSATFHVPAGPWSVSQLGDDFVYGGPRTYRAGHRYRLTLGAASWGPGGGAPTIDSYSHVLLPPTEAMFVDGVADRGSRERTSYRLTHHGRVLVDRQGVDDQNAIHPRLPEPGWYTFTMAATRISNASLATSLSTRSSVRMRFFAHPDRDEQVRAFITRFRPAGLNQNNAAAADRTTVVLSPRRPRPQDRNVHRQSDAVKRVRAWYSVDGGSAWHAVRVVHSGGHWRVSVPNPTSGYVSLRSRVDDTHGGWATTTVIRAYAVT